MPNFENQEREDIVAAICDNGHPLAAGESQCAQCGARIKMQWMKPEQAAITQPADASLPTSAERTETPRPQELKGDPRPWSPAPAGWYPAHDMVGTLRYWDGENWGEQVAPMHPDQVAAQAVRVDADADVAYEDGEGFDGWKAFESGISALAAFGFIYLVFIQDAPDGEVLGIAFTIGILYLVAMFIFRLIKLTIEGTWR